MWGFADEELSADSIKRQRERAAQFRALALRAGQDAQGQMVSGHYVAPNPVLAALASAIPEAMGQYGNAQADKREEELTKLTDKQLADFIARAPKQTEAVPQFGPDQSGAPLPDVQRDKPYDQLAEERQQWAMGGLGIKHPLAQAIAQRGMQQTLDAPERVLEAQLKSQERAKLEQYKLERKAEQDALYRRTFPQALQIAQATGQGVQIVPTGNGYAAVDKGSGNVRPLGISPPESPADKKQAAAEAAKVGSQERAGAILDDLDKNIELLNKNEGITNTQRGPLKNAMSWVQNTAPGQLVGKMAGTENQSARNQIQNLATNLVLELKNLKGLGASQMNSNMELQRYLGAVAGGQDYDYQAMKKAVENARSLMGAASAGSSGGEEKTINGVTYVKRNGAWEEK